MGRPGRGDVADAHAVGQLADEFGPLPRDGLGGLAGFEGVGFGEDFVEDVEVFGIGDAVEPKRVDDLDSAGEVGVDLETVHVADDQQRWAFQVVFVL